MESRPLPSGITRHEYGRTRGFLARVYDDGRCRRRLFSFGVLGGESEALEAAIRWQSEAKGPLAARKQSGGYGYVQRGFRRYRTVSGQVRYYAALIAWFWDDAGKPSSTSFGIRAHGEARAQELCDRWLAGMRGQVSTELAEAV